MRQSASCELWPPANERSSVNEAQDEALVHGYKGVGGQKGRLFEQAASSTESAQKGGRARLFGVVRSTAATAQPT